MPQSVVEKISHLPLAFRGGEKSVVQLIRESGVDCPVECTAAEIVEYLSHHPYLVEIWEQWSQDKRYSSGWFFMRDKDHYVVGFYPNGEKLFFRDPIWACGEFIAREIQSIAENL